MKKTTSYILLGLAAFASMTLPSGCASENPFYDEGGQGVLRLQMVVNSTLTRAYQYTEEDDLRGNCVVYISDLKGSGPLFKWRGLENIPDQITLDAGHYAAEAWTGDSVNVSFDKKFYKGYQEFDIMKDSENSVVVNCHIANVVASVNTSTINPNLMKTDDYSIKVKSSRGEAEFTPDNAEYAKAYFMMPNGDSELEYTISGTRLDGKPFSKTGTIKDVKPAHNYILNFMYNPGSTSTDEELGGAFIQICIKDEELTEQNNVELYGAPSISGNDFDIEKQQAYTEGDIPEHIVKVCGFGGFDELTISSEDFTALGLPSNVFNPLGADESNKVLYGNAGLTYEDHYKESTNLCTYHITFSSEMLSKLPKSDKEHVITITALDVYGKSNQAQLRIANTEGAVVVEDPIIIDPIDTSKDKMSVRARSVDLSFSLADEVNGTPGVEYRMADTNDEWKFMAVTGGTNAPRRSPLKVNKKYTITISDLQPGTRYEYRACSKSTEGDDYHGESMYLTTESIFTLPNNSFEQWSSYSASTLLGTKNVTIPWSEGDKKKSFWGSGNEGSATANMTLTDKSTDMKHSGTYSARLESKSAMGVIAAGNIFIGEYVKTDGTDGVLSVGREYNGSHPSALKVYANYRPAEGVKVKSGNESLVPSGFAGGNDHGQIYVALTTEPVEIRTKAADRKLFNETDNVVVAYGQVSWTGNFGPDGGLEKVEIPLTYKANAKTTAPTHLVIVCSASKYGDFFSGAAGSVMYLDDFELVYE